MSNWLGVGLTLGLGAIGQRGWLLQQPLASRYTAVCQLIER